MLITKEHYLKLNQILKKIGISHEFFATNNFRWIS